MNKMRTFNTKSAKLTTFQVKEMYERMRSGELSQGQAGALYGLSAVQAGRIARGESRAMETGARDNPIPNFNMRPMTLEESMERMKRLMDENERKVQNAPSLYNDRPPEGYDEGANPDLLEKMGLEIEQHQVTRVGNALDKLKGD